MLMAVVVFNLRLKALPARSTTPPNRFSEPSGINVFSPIQGSTRWSIFPKILQRIIERVLLGYGEPGNCLPRILLWVPDFPSILNRLVVKVFAKLKLEEVLCIMFSVEILEPLV